MSVISPSERASVLIEALPYLRSFYGQTIVVKYGGAAMQSEALKSSVMADLALLRYVGIRPILVHGGGPEINSLMDRMNLTPEFVGGLRVTDEATMELVEMALTKTNKSLVASLGGHGSKAIGLSGKDSQLLVAKKAFPEGHDLGFVGDVVDVNSGLLHMLADQGYIPVVCTVAIGQNGETFNVNADTAAGAIAAAVQASKLIILSDVEGLLLDPNDPGSLVSQLTVEEARAMIARGSATKGMIPKLHSCIAAVQSGVSRAHLINGSTPHSMLVEMFTDSGVGTMVIANPPKRPGLSEALLGGLATV